MGAKLDQTHADLARISSALTEDATPILEAKKRKPNIKVGPKKGKGRKFEKQARNLRQLGQGQRPFTDPHDEPHDPGRRPSTQAPVAAPRARTPLPERTAKPLKPVPPTAATEPLKAPAKAPAKPKAPQPLPKPQVVTEPAGDLKKKPQTFLQRVKSKVLSRRREADRKSLPRRAFGVLRRAAGFLKRKILGESQMTRTMRAIALVEERSSTTFKKCAKGAMISSPGMRHSMPKNTFAKPDEDNPTFPIRSGCRASKGGVLRALQKDMSGADEALTKQVLQRINAQGGTRGKDRIKGWGTGVGGKRMETYRGNPHTPKRTDSLAKRLGISKKKASKLHGVSTGRADPVKHTSPYSPAGGSKGPAGNREVHRATGAHSKPKIMQSKRKERRKAASRAVTIARGKALAGG